MLPLGSGKNKVFQGPRRASGGVMRACRGQKTHH